MELSIPDMTCGHCRAAVTGALMALDHDARVVVDLPARRAQVETSAPAAAVIAALHDIGFDAQAV